MSFATQAVAQRRCDTVACNLLKLLGTMEWFVIHHTDCGMALFTDSIIRGL